MSRIRMYVNRELVEAPDSRWPEAMELLTRYLGATSVSVAGESQFGVDADVITFEVPGAPDGATRVDVTYRTGRDAGSLEIHELIWWDDWGPLDPQPVDWKPSRPNRTRVEITPTDDGKATRIRLGGRDVSSLVGRADLTVKPAGDVAMVLHLAKLAPFVDDYAKAVVDPGTADLLQWLGWTPPEDQEQDPADSELTPPGAWQDPEQEQEQEQEQEPEPEPDRGSCLACHRMPVGKTCMVCGQTKTERSAWEAGGLPWNQKPEAGS